MHHKLKLTLFKIVRSFAVNNIYYIFAKHVHAEDKLQAARHWEHLNAESKHECACVIVCDWLGVYSVHSYSHIHAHSPARMIHMGTFPSSLSPYAATPFFVQRAFYLSFSFALLCPSYPVFRLPYAHRIRLILMVSLLLLFSCFGSSSIQILMRIEMHMILEWLP